MGARHTTEIPIPRDRLDEYRRSLRREYGAEVWEHGHTRILIVRVPKDTPDIVNDVELAVEAMAPGDVEGLAHVILLGDRSNNVVPVQPFVDIMADRVAFDKAQCTAIRHELGPDGLGDSAWSYRVFRGRGDPRRALRLGVYAPVDRLADLDDDALDTMARMLGPEAEAGKFIDIACAYLVGRRDDVRMRADEFMEQITSRWQSEAFLHRQKDEQDRRNRIKQAERRALLKDLETRHQSRLGAGAGRAPQALGAGPAGGNNRHGYQEAASAAASARAAIGVAARITGHDAAADGLHRELDRIIGGDRRSPAAAAPIVGNADRFATHTAPAFDTPPAGTRYVDPDVPSSLGANGSARPSLAGEADLPRGTWQPGPGAGQVDAVLDTPVRRPLAQAEDTVTSRQNRPSPPLAGGRGRLLDRLNNAGYSVLQDPAVPGHVIEVAAERVGTFPERIVAWLPLRLDLPTVEAYLATAAALDADLGLIVCDQADVEAQERLVATKVKWLPPQDLDHLHL